MRRARCDNRIHSGSRIGTTCKDSVVNKFLGWDGNSGDLVCPVFNDVNCKFCSPIIDFQVRRASNIYNKKLVIIRDNMFLGLYCNNACMPCVNVTQCPKRLALSFKQYEIMRKPKKK